jgi:hypothetical protein
MPTPKIWLPSEFDGRNVQINKMLCHWYFTPQYLEVSELNVLIRPWFDQARQIDLG